MALGSIVKGFLDKLMSGDKPASEVLKETIEAVAGSQPQQQPGARTAQVGDDAVEQQILRNGYVWQPQLWRRHIMTQMFRLLHRKRGLPISEQNYDELLAKRGANYPWRMLRDELHAQALLWRDDAEQFAERNRWFNRTVVEAMARDLAGQGCEAAGRVLNNLVTAGDPDALLAAIKPMEMPYLEGRQKSLAWLDAYKGAGAYFTMKNLILFHNCQLHLDNGQILDRDASMQMLRDLNANPAVNGQQMFAVMMRLIADNNFDWRH